MLEKYKGDVPDNVMTPQEVKEKKPFYKDWKFWVLSALATLFGFCSVYGFVLGARYVHAIQEAAHVIADGSASGISQSKNGNTPKMLVPPTGYPDYFDFNFSLPSNATNGVYSIQSGEMVTIFTPYTPYFRKATYCHLVFAMGTDNYNNLCFTDYVLGLNTNCTLFASDFSLNYSGVANIEISGRFVYSPFNQGYQEGHSDGYDEGYQEGHSDGYEEGYDDGYQALAGSQTINVTFDENFPKLNDIHYSWSVDGSVVDSGSINVRPNVQIPVKTFTRPGGYTHNAELNLWSENDEPLIIAYGRHEGLVIGGQQNYIYDTYNKTNAYQFGENSRYVWYVPTYWPNALFYIYSYGTWNQGYANDCYFEFDPEHNDRSKVGAYADGYQDGYHDATESGEAYDAGKEVGYEQGYQTGVTDGRNQGYAQATGGTKALAYMFVTAFQQPFDQLYRFLNFNLLGINLLALFSALVTLSLGIYVLKKVL